MRTFVALNLPSKLRARLHAAAEPIREAMGASVTWTGEPALHVTLKFLGDQREDAVARLAASIADMTNGRTTFPLRIGGIGAFPSLDRPRVLWIGVEANPALAALYQQVEAACVDLGIPREARPYHPHVTLGRVRPRARVDGRALARAAAAIDFRAVTPARSVDVMESVLGPGGSRYRVVAAIPLSTVEES